MQLRLTCLNPLISACLQERTTLVCDEHQSRGVKVSVIDWTTQQGASSWNTARRSPVNDVLSRMQEVNGVVWLSSDALGRIKYRSSIFHWNLMSMKSLNHLYPRTLLCPDMLP